MSMIFFLNNSRSSSAELAVWPVVFFYRRFFKLPVLIIWQIKFILYQAAAQQLVCFKAFLIFFYHLPYISLGSFQGQFEKISATDLGAVVITEALKRANLTTQDVDGVIMGQVCQNWAIFVFFSISMLLFLGFDCGSRTKFITTSCLWGTNSFICTRIYY